MADKEIVIIAGPNGAGKTTFALTYLRVQRVAQGGHNIPEEVIRRRFEAGLKNLHDVYSARVDDWVLFDNSGLVPVVIDRRLDLDQGQ